MATRPTRNWPVDDNGVALGTSGNALVTSGGGGSSTPTIAGPLGRAADASSVSTALSTENVAILGALAETAPASDTASSGLNGRLQRIAQRLTSLIALLPTSLDGNALRVKAQRAATPTQTSVAGSATSVSLLASNTARLGATIYNDSTAVLYLKLGATASTTSYSAQLPAGAYYEVPFNYTGAIDGIWVSATGNARITELA